jgi:hypothetical protein
MLENQTLLTRRTQDLRGIYVLHVEVDKRGSLSLNFSDEVGFIALPRRVISVTARHREGAKCIDFLHAVAEQSLTYLRESAALKGTNFAAVLATPTFLHLLSPVCPPFVLYLLIS